MKIGNKPVKVFKIKNRRGYAAICADCLTEGRSRQEAVNRMEKAVKRIMRKRR